MKFAKQKWVRVTEARIIEIINEGTIHPTYLEGYCAGCHSALAGQPWAGVWAEVNGDRGPYKLCQKCTAEAKAEAYWEGFTCPICGEGFTLEQWDKRHSGKNGEEYHEDCCPECKDGASDDEEDEHPIDCTCEECAEVLRSAGYELMGDEVLYSAEYDWADDDDEDTGLYQCLCEDNVGRMGKCEYCGGQIIPF